MGIICYTALSQKTQLTGVPGILYREPLQYSGLFTAGFRSETLAQCHVIEESGLSKHVSPPFRLLFLASSSSVHVPRIQDNSPHLQNSTTSSSTSPLCSLSELSVSGKGYFCCGRTSALWGGGRGWSSEGRRGL